MKHARATSIDPLKRQRAKTISLKGPRPGTRLRKDGTLAKSKNFVWPDSFARRFDMYCAARDLNYSDFTVDVLGKYMDDNP